MCFGDCSFLLGFPFTYYASGVQFSDNVQFISYFGLIADLLFAGIIIIFCYKYLIKKRIVRKKYRS